MDAALFGLIVADLIAEPMNLRQPPPPGGLAFTRSIQLTSGGNVSNTGIAMAKLGMRVAAAGMVGNDILGTAMIERLRSQNLDTSHVFVSDQAQTSASVVAIEPGGERVFFHTPGVTPLLDANAFRRCFDLFAKCAFVQVGYFGLLPTLTPDMPTVFAELKARAPQTKIAFDTVNPPADPKLLWPILPHVDLFCPSRQEAAAVTGQSDPQQMIAALRRHMPKHALIGIKLDAEGCLLDDGHQQCFAPAYKIDCIDTTGAGDTWFGALLTAIHHRMPLQKAARFANRAAADCCTAIGASAGVRSFEDTLARI